MRNSPFYSAAAPLHVAWTKFEWAELKRHNRGDASCSLHLVFLPFLCSGDLHHPFTSLAPEVVSGHTTDERANKSEDGLEVVCIPEQHDEKENEAQYC